ncbi:MAG: hypothetical protein ACE5FI_04450 [Anaerolineales bacterium]
MTTRPRLFLYALLAFGVISFISFLWGFVAISTRLRDGLQILMLFGLGAWLVPLSLREFRALRIGAAISARRRRPLLLMSIASACLGILALLLGLGTLGRIFDWPIAGVLSYGLYGFGAIGLGLSILAVSQLLLQRTQT